MFMTSKNSKTSEHHALMLTLTDKIDSRRAEKMMFYQILAFITHEKT